MAVRLSRFYNDPSIGKGFEALAGALAPPEATDQLAAEKALQLRAEATRVADLFANPSDPNFDRRMTVLGRQTGSQSLEAVGMNNRTTLTTNARDNATKLQQEALQQSGQTDRSMLNPIGQDQVRIVPGKLASLYGVQEQQYGPASLAQGETVVRPDGSRLEGAAKPLSESEAKGAAFNRLGPDDMRRIVMNGAGTQNAIVDGQPRVVYGADAADRGLAPAATPTAPTFVGNYEAGGVTGPAVLDNGRIVNPQSREAIPANAQVRSAAVTGTPDQFGKSTEREGTAAYAARMVDGATNDILQAFDTGRLPTRADAALRSASEMAPGIIAPEIITRMSPEGQQFYQNVRTALPMQLLVQTGQGVTEREYERKMAELVPVPGEDKTVTAAKRRQFATYAAAVKGLAGNALGKVNAIPAAANPNAPAAAAPAPGGTPENTVIENDAGQRMIRRGGKWEPYNG